MLNYAEIEDRLGAPVVKKIEAAILEGMTAAEQSAHPDDCTDAMRYLLISLLAAVTLTPKDGSLERAAQTITEFIELVEAANHEAARESTN